MTRLPRPTGKQVVAAVERIEFEVMRVRVGSPFAMDLIVERGVFSMTALATEGIAKAEPLVSPHFR